MILKWLDTTRIGLPAALLTGILLAGVSVRAAQTIESATYAVIVTGLGGEESYEKILDGWGRDLAVALKTNGVAADRLFWLAAKQQEGVYALSRQEEIRKLLGQLAGRIRTQDVFQLFLIGHGSYDGYDYRLDIPGPDLTGSQWGELLNRIPAERQLVVNTSSSSGASMDSFRRNGRVVIVSTSAGQERNFSVFARYFVAALQDLSSDTDKNQEISALEAYRYATREVARYYEDQKRLATEHALLEDRGEGEGVRDPNPANGQGVRAAALTIMRLGSQSTGPDTPEARELRATKRALEEAIEALKYRKASMDTEEYNQQLEELLVELSQTQARLDALATGGGE